MTGIARQFHATPGETVAFALDGARDHGLILVVERFFPSYEATVVADVQGPLDRARFPVVDRLALCRAEPDLTSTRAHHFVERNADSLFILTGRSGNAGLRVAALNGATNEPTTLRKWRAMLRALTSSMHAGASVRKPLSGAEGRFPHHRHTPGAHELARYGVPMLALAGWNEYRFDDIEPESEVASTGGRTAARHRVTFSVAD